MTAIPHMPNYNQTFEARFRAGWIGLFAGENQTKSVRRQIAVLNSQDLRVAALVLDRWSIWRRLLWALILICTLGFVGRVPNVLIVTEPMQKVPLPTPSSPDTTRLPVRNASDDFVLTAARTANRPAASTMHATAPRPHPVRKVATRKAVQKSIK